jgi:hypothetical protein
MSVRYFITFYGLVVACSSQRSRALDSAASSSLSPSSTAAKAAATATAQPDTSLEARSRFDLRAGDLSGEKQTRLRLEILQGQLARFYQEHSKLPEHLSDILKMSASEEVRRPNSRWLLDGWGRPFSYSRTALPDSFTLRSPGPDGKLGTGDDIVVEGSARSHAP